MRPISSIFTPRELVSYISRAAVASGLVVGGRGDSDVGDDGEGKGDREGDVEDDEGKTREEGPAVILRDIARDDFLALGEQLKEEWEEAKALGEKGTGSWQLWTK